MVPHGMVIKQLVCKAAPCDAIVQFNSCLLHSRSNQTLFCIQYIVYLNLPVNNIFRKYGLNHSGQRFQADLLPGLMVEDQKVS